MRQLCGIDWIATVAPIAGAPDRRACRKRSGQSAPLGCNADAIRARWHRVIKAGAIKRIAVTLVRRRSATDSAG